MFKKIIINERNEQKERCFMIKLSEFEVLMKLLQNSNKTQREIAEDLNVSLQN